MQCGAVAEWSKALAWKVSIRQKRIQGSNPCRSASHPQIVRYRCLVGEVLLIASQSQRERNALFLFADR